MRGEFGIDLVILNSKAHLLRSLNGKSSEKQQQGKADRDHPTLTSRMKEHQQ
jgi:hypothetical protein